MIKKNNSFFDELNGDKSFEFNEINFGEVGICFDCKEGIFNPICADCLSNEIKAWLKDISLKHIVNEKTLKIIKKIIAIEIDKVKEIKLINEKCMKCEGRVLLCPYCFTERVYLALKNKTDCKNKKIVKNFLTYFNFDFDHTGYSKENE